MGAVHDILASRLREVVASPELQYLNWLATEPDIVIFRHLFFNFSPRRRSMQLTGPGFDALSRVADYTSIKIQKWPLNSREIMYLERRTDFPYFLEKGHIHTFDTEFAVFLRLQDGDITEMIAFDPPRKK